jgi:hypothetical protein
MVATKMTPEQIAEAQKLEPKPKPEMPQPKSLSGWRQQVLGFFR